jgi:hypothetical protein
VSSWFQSLPKKCNLYRYALVLRRVLSSQHCVVHSGEGRRLGMGLRYISVLDGCFQIFVLTLRLSVSPKNVFDGVVLRRERYAQAQT